MTVRTLEQVRAEFAWKKVEEVREANEAKNFKRYAKGAPALIMNNGLMQALAFYQSRTKDNDSDPTKMKRGPDAAKLLVRAVLVWLGERHLISLPNSQGDVFGTGMQKLHEQSSTQYLRATNEALEILRWIRQFADARIEG